MTSRRSRGGDRVTLITGESGFIGGAIHRDFVKRGVAVHGLRELVIRRDPAATPRFWTAEQVAGLGLEVDTIIHCAGNASIKGSFNDPRADFTANLSQVLELLEYIRRTSPETRLVLFSTSAVYGGASAPSSETQRGIAVSPYGLHKAMAEDLVSFYGKSYGVRAAIIRPLSVYGPGQRKQIIWDALNRFRSGDFHFLGGGGNVRDFIHIDDLVDLVPLVIAATRREVPVFNASSGEGYTIRCIMETLAELYGRPGRVSFGDATWPGDPSVLVGLNDKARALGWSPRIALRVGLKSTIQWFEHLHDE